MPFQIIRNDITRVRADAVVNTANPQPVCGRGTDFAVYEAAGMEDMLRARREIGELRPGEVGVTPGFALPASFVLHTVGPVWQGGGAGEADILAACYRNALLKADELGCGSVAIPLIATGVYGFPKDKALEIAVAQISAFLLSHEMDVLLVVFSKEAFDLSRGIFRGVAELIGEQEVRRKAAAEYGIGRREDLPMPSVSRPAPKAAAPRPLGEDRPGLADRIRDRRRRRTEDAAEAPMAAAPYPGDAGIRYDAAPAALPDDTLFDAAPVCDEVLSAPAVWDEFTPSETFQQKLLQLIDERGLKDAEVYKRANLDRKHFSKIRCNTQYRPTKKTAVALAIALRLDLEETRDLLSRAELAFSPSNLFDLIVSYFIERKDYNIYDINLVLFKYDQQLLGA